MSTLKATFLQQAASTNPNITLDGSANATVGGTLAMGSSFKRNRIINGNAQVAQRGTSFTNVSSGSLTNQYTLDRWWGFRSAYASNLSMSQQAGFGNSQYCLRFGRANGDTSTAVLSIGQIIESVNMVDLQGQTVTLSFFARTSPSGYSGGAMSVYLYSGTTADQGLASFIGGWAGSATPIVTSQSLTSTATRYTFTGTIASNALELLVNFQYTPTGTAGATDYIEITNVQLEVGSVATPYERQIYSDQLAQCQRYYYKVINAGTYCGFGSGFIASTNSNEVIIPFPVTMRIAPTAVETSGTPSQYQIRYAATATDCNGVPTFASASINSSNVTASVAGTPLTVGQGSLLRNGNNTTAYLAWSVEL